MSYWNRMGLLRKDDNKCFGKAILEVRGVDRIEKYKFRYKTISDEVITNSSSVLNMDYDSRAEGIFVYDYKLPFVNGARVKFLDGTSLVVSSITKVIDDEKAQADGVGLVGLNIYFGG